MLVRACYFFKSFSDSDNVAETVHVLFFSLLRPNTRHLLFLDGIFNKQLLGLKDERRDDAELFYFV